MFQASNTLNLCNFLQSISQETWNRIQFAHSKKNFKTFETTITQNILYNLHVFSTNNPHIPIKMFEAVDEPLNGNDIEFIIKTSNGYLVSPLQAKIIYQKKYDYPAMEHGNQINDLISYANSLGGVALYLLYNFYPDKTFKPHTKICNIELIPADYGCTLISAQYLSRNFAFNRIDKNGNRKWAIPSFIQLHPNIAVPLLIVGCCEIKNLTAVDVAKLLTNSTVDISKIKTYQIDELINSLDWKAFELKSFDKSYNSIPDIEFNLFNDETKDPSNSKFQPKYRIVIG